MSMGNKPAYPIAFEASDNPCNFTITNPGITFRERLIVAAMQGLCANPSIIRADQEYDEDYKFGFVPWLARKLADSQIAALEKEDGQ